MRENTEVLLRGFLQITPLQRGIYHSQQSRSQFAPVEASCLHVGFASFSWAPQKGVLQADTPTPTRSAFSTGRRNASSLYHPMPTSAVSRNPPSPARTYCPQQCSSFPSFHSAWTSLHCTLLLYFPVKSHETLDDLTFCSLRKVKSLWGFSFFLPLQKVSLVSVIKINKAIEMSPWIQAWFNLATAHFTPFLLSIRLATETCTWISMLFFLFRLNLSSRLSC